MGYGRTATLRPTDRSARWAGGFCIVGNTIYGVRLRRDDNEATVDRGANESLRGVRGPHLIVMDEPAKHMELPSIACLEDALGDFP